MSNETVSHSRHRNESPKKSMSREVIEWVISLVVAVALGLFLHFLVFQLVRVEGPSMQNTLYTNQLVFSTPATYLFREPVRGEVVITKYPDRPGEHFVKRVIGLPGETVEIKDGYVFINGQQLNEDYTKDNKIYYEMAAITVPEDCVFVLGDNRNNSNDSHDSSVGPIPLSYLQGKAHFILWPLNKIASLSAPDYNLE